MIRIDVLFRALDLGAFTVMHELAMAVGENPAPEISAPFTLFMHFVSLLAHDGIGMILLALLLMFPRRTRKMGACVLVAVCCGAVITNLTLKPLVARVRPYADFAHLADTVRPWWIAVGEARKGENILASFPSGHTTCATATAVGLFLAARKKKIVWPVLIFPLLMGTSRIYLMVHYASDVLAGLLCGAIGGTVGYLIVTRLLYPALEKHREKRFCRFFLEFDLITCLKERKKARNAE